MRRNVVRLFSLYNFFSVFLPGFVFLLGIAPLLPAGVPIDAVTALVPLLALGFVIGQAIHSLAVRAEETFGHERHRALFLDELTGEASRFDDGLVREFRSCYRNSDFGDRIGAENDEEAEQSTDRRPIYVLVQSYVHTRELGRSRTFQAVYAFCRSLWFESFFLMFLYWSYSIYAVVAGGTYHSLLSTSGSLLETLLLSTAICGFCVFVFKYAADQYREYFVQYLLADFVVLSRRNVEGA